MGDAIGPSLPKRSRKSPATKAEVEAVLKRVKFKTGSTILRQPMKAFYRRLVNIAGVADLASSTKLRKDAVECMVSTAQGALESAPSSKVLGKLLHTLQQLEASSDA